LSLKELAKRLARDMKEQDSVKLQFDSADVSAYFELFDDDFQPKNRGIRIKERSLAGDVLIWGNTSFGTWNSYKWGDVSQTSFVLGHSIAGILGTSKLGSNLSSFATLRVVHPNNTYVESFNSTFFKDTASTDAAWGTTGEVVFGTSSTQTASSLIVYKNNQAITSAKLTATTTGSGSIGFFMSADGTNYEAVSSGVSHTFTNTGSELYWRATGSGISITSLEIEY